jgi:uncharacterized membrane protein (DUF485 family)
MDDVAVQRIRQNPKFIELEHKRSRFSWTLTILMLVIYYGYICLVAFAPGVLGQKLSAGGATTLGMPLGVGVILVAIVLTGIYVWRANGEFDRLTREIVEDRR